MRVSDMLRGEPGLPMRFHWRGKEYAVAEVLEKWKTTGPCHHGSDEQYVRQHWWRVLTEDGLIMELACDRQKRRGRPRPEWRLLSVQSSADRTQPNPEGRKENS